MLSLDSSSVWLKCISYLTIIRQERRNQTSHLLVNQVNVRPHTLTEVQVAHRVSRQVSSGQDDGVSGNGAQNLPAEPLHHGVTAQIALPEMNDTFVNTMLTVSL